MFSENCIRTQGWGFVMKSFNCNMEWWIHPYRWAGECKHTVYDFEASWMQVSFSSEAVKPHLPKTHSILAWA